jgi:uncharacterized protein with GYD domain
MGSPQEEPKTGRTNAMPTYVTLIKFTGKGIEHVKDTVKRHKAFESGAKKRGVTLKEVVWTLGAHDMVAIFEAPDDETAAIAMLSGDELGNVRTETMRAFTVDEMDKLLAKVD